MNEPKQNKFINIIVKKDSVIKELEKSLLFKYDDTKTFFFPKRLLFKKVISNNNERMFDKVDINTEDYTYITLSVPRDSNFTSIEISEPVKVQNEKGEWVIKRDENGKNIYNKEEISIFDLKENFREESNQIFEEVKQAKNML